MSTDKVGQPQDPEVLAQAFPQLGNTGSDSRGSKNIGSDTGLHVVPAPKAGPATPGTALAVAESRHTHGVERFWNVPVTMKFEVGRQDISVQQLMTLKRGSIVPLKNVYVDQIKVRVGERTIARGEAISLKNQYGVRISEITVPSGTEPGRN
ncbi:MAG: FliM/FliN family flagellar motor C-terminal domain-containing protein [Gammaproteobacteria bacterium]|nr:FliM/FliN family flagellar motor switch protein [Pseudomonadales bacterium]MCP5349046.1 FliM/FliN family flagellar motor switch protein [Pseudomonadales bacterium]